VLSKPEENHQKMQQTIDSLQAMLLPVPNELLKVSNQISAVSSLLSTIAQSGPEIHNIFLGVKSLQDTMKGL
jgi:hypothetical protein